MSSVPERVATGICSTERSNYKLFTYEVPEAYLTAEKEVSSEFMS
jgi:hypothetical protein